MYILPLSETVEDIASAAYETALEHGTEFLRKKGINVGGEAESDEKKD